MKYQKAILATSSITAVAGYSINSRIGSTRLAPPSSLLTNNVVPSSSQRRHHQYRSSPSSTTFLRSSTEDIDAAAEPVFEDVDGIGETTVGGESTTPASASSAPEVPVVPNMDIPIIELASQAAAQTAASSPVPVQVPVEIEVSSPDASTNPTPVGVTTGTSTSTNTNTAIGGSDDKKEVMTAFPAFVEDAPTSPTSSSTAPGSLEDEIIMAEDKKLLDPSIIVEDIIGNAIDNINGSASIDTNAGTTTISDSGSGSGNSEEDIQEILTTALIDPDVHGQISTKELRKAEEELALAKEDEEEPIIAPDITKIIKFAIPAVGVWLCSPLLSLIDTSSVGLLSGTVQQAALNPAVAVTDYSALLVAFMYTATTNLVAGTREKENKLKGGEMPETKKTLTHALQLSGYVGVVLGTILAGFAPTLLKTIIGNEALDPAVFAAALRYVRIRALGMPAAVVIGSAQSASIGLQDVKSPMYVLLAAAVVNFLGDVVFVPRAHAWLGGAAGAAWATVFSQYAALGLFLTWLRTKSRSQRALEEKNSNDDKPDPVNLTQAILELTGESSEGKARRKDFRKSLHRLSWNGVNTASTDSSTVNEEVKDEASESTNAKPKSRNPIKRIFSRKAKNSSPSATSAAAVDTPTEPKEPEFNTRGFLSGQFRKRDLLKFPPLEEAKQFWPYVIPVSTTSFGRVSAYVAMSHVVSSSLGTLSMAANQVILSVFYCLTPIADSLNLTAQSFIPGIHHKKKGPARAAALKEATNNFMKVGALFGLGMVSLVSLVPFFCHYFTTDPFVIAKVKSVVPLLLGVFSVHGIICAGEGLLLGQTDLGFIGRTYAAYFVGVPYFMLRLKKIAQAGTAVVGLTSLWEVFMYYQFVRAAVWGVRLRQLNKKAGTASALASM